MDKVVNWYKILHDGDITENKDAVAYLQDSEHGNITEAEKTRCQKFKFWRLFQGSGTLDKVGKYTFRLTFFLF